jgi:hypothetical protein
MHFEVLASTRLSRMARNSGYRRFSQPVRSSACGPCAVGQFRVTPSVTGAAAERDTSGD